VILVPPEYKDSQEVLGSRVKPDQLGAQDSLALMGTLVVKVKKVSRDSLGKLGSKALLDRLAQQDRQVTQDSQVLLV